jgi:hypothetical protein
MVFMSVQIAGYCAGEIATVIALTMMTSQTPHWNNIANTVKTIPHTLRGKLIFKRHTAIPQAINATSGMRQNSKTTRPSGGAGTCILSRIITKKT